MSLIVVRRGGPPSVPGGGGGSLTHGSLYTINGSGFGTRANNNTEGYTWKGQSHLHFRFTTFERGSPLAATQAAWLTATNGFAPNGNIASGGDARTTIVSGSGSVDNNYFRRTDFAGASDRVAGLSVLEASNNGVAPAGGPIYFASTYRQPNSETGNYKPFRIYTSGTTDTYISTGGWDGVVGHAAPLDYTAYREPDFVGMSGSAIELVPPPTINTWLFHELLLAGGATASAIRHNGNKVTLTNSNPFSSTALPIFDTTDGPGQSPGHTIDLCHMCETSTGNDTYLDFDNAVVDWTFSRVVRGDASTYAACTWFEPQCCISWSNTSITIALNQGRLSGPTGTYAYVFNADTLVNSSGIALV